MEYKVGSKVLMGSKKWQSDRISGNMVVCHVVYPDQVVTIESISGNLIDVRFNNASCSPCDESQILGPAFEYGEEIEVEYTKGQGRWYLCKFCSYAPGSRGTSVCVECDSGIRRFAENARPLPVKDKVPVVDELDKVSTRRLLEAALRQIES